MNDTNLKNVSFGVLAGVLLAGSVMIYAQGCGGSSSSGSTLSVSSMATVLKKSLPAGLVPGATAVNVQIRPNSKSSNGIKDKSFSATSTMSVAQAYLTNLFQNTYSATGTGTSNVSVKGYLMSLVTTADNRTSLYNGSSTSSFPCLSATTKSYSFNASALNPKDTTSPNMLNFTLANVQCNAIFSGAQGTTGGSGEVFGIKGNDTSEWVTISDMSGDAMETGGAFVEMANLTNAGVTVKTTPTPGTGGSSSEGSSTGPETLNGLYITYAGTTSGRYNIVRYKAIPSGNVFEMYMAANMANSFSGTASSNGSMYMPDVRVISDGNYIYADGVLCFDTTGANCGGGTTTLSGSASSLSNPLTITNTNGSSGSSDWEVFQVCLNASTLAVVDPVATSDCLTLANSFSLSPNVTSYTTQGIFTTGGTPVTEDVLNFANITGDTNYDDTWVAGTDVPTAANFTSTEISALNSIYSANNAKSVTTAW